MNVPIKNSPHASRTDTTRLAKRPLLLTEPSSYPLLGIDIATKYVTFLLTKKSRANEEKGEFSVEILNAFRISKKNRSKLQRPNKRTHACTQRKADTQTGSFRKSLRRTRTRGRRRRNRSTSRLNCFRQIVLVAGNFLSRAWLSRLP